MSSLAQEESRSISENVTWGQRKRFADGKVSLPYSQFLGYKKGKDGLPEIVPEEAEIVRRIYTLFIEGKATCGIAKQLTAEGIPTPGGKVKWQASTIESILTNEKYKGDALLQKAFTVDFLTKKQKKNEGEVPQYYVEKSHPAIIEPDEWQLVQTEFERRKAIGRKYSGNSVFSSRLVCGECGEFFGNKTWHSNDPYRKTIWRCNHKYDGDKRCATPILDEEEVKERFLQAMSKLLSGKDALLEDCRMMQTALTDYSAIDAELDELLQELTIVTELTQRCIKENASSAQSQEEYIARYEGLTNRYETASQRVGELESQKAQRQNTADSIGAFMFTIHELDEVALTFNTRLWLTTIDRATIHSDGRITFRFISGVEVDV